MMDETNFGTAGYQVPTYKLGRDEAWFHFLHGNVPGHQIDYIYRPVVPQDPLTRQHWAHLSRVVKYIEPRPGMAYGFAITNLSRDDSQYEPGHGGVAFVFGLRIKGARDHAGRQDPPFCHSAAIIDRHLDVQTLYHISTQFYQKLLPDEESQAEGSGWYHTYVHHAQNANVLLPLLKGYVADFADLYVPPPSQLTLRWTVENSTPPRRVVVVYPDRADFATIAYCMARIAAVLVESDIKWSAISNGREQDLTGGLTVRFVPRREADNVAEENEVLLYLEQVPESPADIALLFNAHPARMSRLPDLQVKVPSTLVTAKINGGAQPETTEPPRSWRENMRAAPAPVEPPAQTPGLGGLVAVVEKKEAPVEPLIPAQDWAKEIKKKERKQGTLALAGTALFIVVFGALAVIWFASAPTLPPEEPKPAAPPVRIQDAPPIVNPPATQALPTNAPVPTGTQEAPATIAAPSVTAAPTNAVPTATSKPAPTGTTKKPTKKKPVWPD